MARALLLTGCAGFVGFNFLAKFKERKQYKNYDYIYSIDKLGYISALTKESYIKICDELNIERYDASINLLAASSHGVHVGLKFKEYDEVDVLDFASSSHVDVSINQPDVLFQDNAVLPSHILQILSLDNISTYYHISTDEVYGDIDLEFRGDPKNGEFTIESPYKPSNPYSASKVAQDAYLESMSRTFGLKTVLIRMANQFGPYQYFEKMIPASLQRVCNGQKIKIYGKGDNCRQWTYIEDTVEIISDIIDGKFIEDKNYQVIHLADPDNLLDNNELIDKLISVMKNKGFNPEKEYIDDRLGHDKMYCLKVSDDIARHYKTKFDDALEKTIDYYLNHFGK